MLKVSLFTILFIFCEVVIAQNISPDWNLTRDDIGVKVWLHKNDSESVFTYQQNMHKKNLPWSQVKGSKFFLDLTNKKKKLLEMIGIRNWSVLKHEWSKNSSSYELNLEGKYQDSQQNWVSFCETHIFTSNGTHQFLLTTMQSQPITKNLKAEMSKLKAKVLGQ